MEMNYHKFKDNNTNGDNERSMLIDNYNYEKYNYDLEENHTKRPMVVPEFIINQKTFCEKSLYKILCCSKYRTFDKIDQKELKAYYKLKDIGLVLYDEHNKDHENSLKHLFISALNIDTSDNLETLEWKSIGFQNHNPRTDFRAGGYLSLLFLNFFVGQYKDEFEKMNHIDNFMTAVAAIRLTFLFKITFNLLEKTEDCSFLIKQYKLKKISFPLFKTFLKYQSKDDNFIFDLFSKCLVKAKDTYLKLYNNEHGLRNIYNLDIAVDKAFDHVFFTELIE